MNNVFRKFSSIPKHFRWLQLCCYSLLFAQIWISGSTLSHAASASAIVSSNQIVQNETIMLTITYEGSDASQDDFDAGLLMTDFYTGSTSFGSSYSNINGKTTQKKTWQVSLTPKKQGQLQIPELQIADARTQAINVTVSRDPNARQTQSRVKFNATLSSDHLFPNESATLHTQLIIKGQARFDRHQFFPPQADGMDLQQLTEQKKIRPCDQWHPTNCT